MELKKRGTQKGRGQNIKIMIIFYFLQLSLQIFAQTPIVATISSTKELIFNRDTILEVVVNLKNASNEVVNVQLRCDTSCLFDYFLISNFKGNCLFQTYTPSGVTRIDGIGDVDVYPKLNFIPIDLNDSLDITFNIFKPIGMFAFLFKFSYDKNAFLNPDKFYYKAFDKIVILGD
jgi:hypothetical protein